MDNKEVFSRYRLEINAFIRRLIEYTEKRDIEWIKYSESRYVCRHEGTSVCVESLKGRSPKIVVGNINEVEDYSIDIPELVAAIEKRLDDTTVTRAKTKEELEEQQEELRLQSFLDASNNFLSKFSTPL